MPASNFRLICVFAFLACLPPLSEVLAEVRVAGIFGDNMVVQRDAELPIWGWSDPGDPVTVMARSQKVTTRCDENGKWIVHLRPMKLGKPFTISITGSDNAVTIDNVVAGEVWICSGQSNMEWTVSRSANAEQEKSNANYPSIRHIKIGRQFSTKPEVDAKNSGWQICSPETVGEFTAVGYYFGRKIHRDLNVPVGLINSSWGGTIVEAWTSGDSLISHPDFGEKIREVRSNESESDKAKENFQAQLTSWQQQFNVAMENSNELAARDFDDTQWKQLDVPGRWEEQGFKQFDGAAWYRKSITVPDNWVGKDLSLSLAKIDDNDRTFVNGRMVGKTQGWNRNRIYKVPAELVGDNRLSIAVQVIDTGGSGGFSVIDEPMELELEDEPPISIDGKWKFKTTDLISKIPRRPQPPGFNGPNNPTGLFNGMINPLVPFSLRGAIWYQGESNASRGIQYRSLFPLLIKDWRQKWNRPLPFYWVQLANFRATVELPEQSEWAELREAQSMALSLPSTGEAVIIDIGEAKDIHPKNKQDVGLRLALIALKNDYGINVASSGPRFRGMTIESNKIRLTFDYSNGLKTIDGKPPAKFSIAGEDKKFVWADAEIHGEEIIVTNSGIANPVAVRYAWADNPEGCNLTNDSGLPASPFRTDQVIPMD